MSARMTKHEAVERACRIWGTQRLISVWKRKDGGADVNLQPAGASTDWRERNHSFHRLDADGRVACHDDCKALDS